MRRQLLPGFMLLLLLAGCGGGSSATSSSAAPRSSSSSSTGSGSHAPPSGVWRNAFSVFLEHWDGRSWSSSDAPPGGASLSWRWTAPGIEVVGVFGHPQTPGG